jgi:predicted nucleic acid-binding protein
MKVLVDTNVLTRVAHRNHPHTPLADAALQRLWVDGHELRIVPQVLYEYWSVATRPPDNNGLGFPPDLVAADVERFKSVFAVLRDERGVLEPWQRIALDCRALGKQAHDAHLVAAMQKHGLTHILTFNTGDFARYPNVATLSPSAVVAAKST